MTLLGYPLQAKTQANNFSKSEAYCLAQVIYFEARGESLKGQIAVAQVALNRVTSQLFPDTMCSVVYQTKPSCQFSWYCDGTSDTLPQNESAIQSKSLAKKLLTSELADITDGALFFHASSINPRWNKLEKTVEIGSHVFYRIN